MTRIQTLLEMRRTIEELVARVDAIEGWIAPDETEQPRNRGNGQIEIPAQVEIQSTATDSEDRFRKYAAQIETKLVKGIKGLTWASYSHDEATGEIVFTAPMEHSNAAKYVHGCSAHDVKWMRQEPALWDRVEWYLDYPPNGYPRKRKGNNKIPHIRVRFPS